MCIEEGNKIMSVKDILLNTIDKINTMNDGRVNSLLEPKLVDFDQINNTATISFKIKDWEKNQRGECHGGIVATMFDVALGISAKAYSDHPSTATADLSVNYIRPFLEEEYYFVVEAVNIGKNLIRLRGTAVSPITKKVAATAQATFVRVKS